MRYHSHPKGRLKSEQITSIVKDVEKLELSYTASWNVSYHLTQKFHSYACAQEKAYVHTKICTQIFTAAFFTVAKTWKQLNAHQLMNELTKFLFCICIQCDIIQS